MWLWFACNCPEHAGGWVLRCDFNNRGKSPSWLGLGRWLHGYTGTHADQVFIHVQSNRFSLQPILDNVDEKKFATFVYRKCSRKTSPNRKFSTIFHDATQCTALSGPRWSCRKSRYHPGDAKTHLASLKCTEQAGTSHLTCTSWRFLRVPGAREL